MMKSLRGINHLPDDAQYDEMDSPVGVLTIITSDQGLHAVLWDNEKEMPGYHQIIGSLRRSSNGSTMIAVKKQINEYFQSKRRCFDLPLVFNGTDFQKKAWEALLKIPYGATISYSDQAQYLGNKNKARAVGAANGLNPISIIVPCHRVIGAKGQLTGFAGGLDKKSILLQLEGRNL